VRIAPSFTRGRTVGRGGPVAGDFFGLDDAALTSWRRIAGHYLPGRGISGVGLEKHPCRRLFPINLTNGFGTSYG
jgi:hypothetical protein